MIKMFNADFFPTPEHVIHEMTYGYDLSDKIILEPSAGKGNIVDYIKQHGAKQVIACEKNKDLKKIVESKCKVIAEDFIEVTSDMISHIDCIIGNPPFSADDKHILHAFDIAPAGCTIIMLCNWETYRNPWSSTRSRLRALIDQHGSCKNLGSCFEEAERETDVKIGLVCMKKPGETEGEFAGFFMYEESEEQANGLMPYNFVRDLVNRYIGAVKLFDKQLEIGVQMSQLTNTFFKSDLSFSCTSNNQPVLRNDYKKDLQKSAWRWVFNRMKMDKYTTKGLQEDINKFVEKQSEVPFTMRNIYKMLEIIIGTTGSRMDRAILEVFNKLTEHYHENRFNVEGWKTNSHYLVNEKFIMPYLAGCGWHGEVEIKDYQNSNYQLLEDLIKAMCYITGENYDNVISLRNYVRYPFNLKRDGKYLSRTFSDNFACWDKRSEAEAAQQEYAKNNIITTIVDHGKIVWGQWFDYSFFQIKCYKKGTCHLKFKDRDVWAILNQNICRIMGHPLPEAIKTKTKK